METKQQSPFFTAISEAITSAKKLCAPDDSILTVCTDGEMSLRLASGNIVVLQEILLSFMQINPQVAEIICRAALDYHRQIKQQPILRVSPPPVPKDGVASWPKHTTSSPILPNPITLSNNQ